MTETVQKKIKYLDYIKKAQYQNMNLQFKFKPNYTSQKKKPRKKTFLNLIYGRGFWVYLATLVPPTPVHVCQSVRAQGVV